MGDHTVPIDTLRASFAAGVTRPMKWRMQQLKAFATMLKEGKKLLFGALYKDLHKNPMESYSMELYGTINECKHAMKNLQKWMTPTEVKTDMANLPGKSFLYHDPLGVVCIIGAWNYPVYLSLMPLVGAIAGGNCVCLKVPSQKYSKHTSSAIAFLIGKYMDQKCIRVVEGDRHATTAVLNEKWDKLFFTGGSMVGTLVAESAARHLTPTVLELGGKSPTIVDNDLEDMEVAARRVAWGAFINAGQTCVRPDYLFVHSDIADAFVTQLRQSITQFYGTNPKASTSFGRLINQRAVKRVAGLLESDQQFIVCGGQVDASDKYVAPTLLDFGEDMSAFASAACMQDEIFGPVLPICRYRNLTKVLGFINRRDKPLALYVYTKNTDVSEEVLCNTSAGGANVNDSLMHLGNPNLPFGGVGRSGMGSYHGKFSFLTFTHQKSVLKKTLSNDFAMRYPPYPKL